MPQQLEIEKPHLVWVTGLRGPEPQKWSSLDYGVYPNNHRKNSVRAAYPLTDAEFKLPIDVLARLYPSPDDQYE